MIKDNKLQQMFADRHTDKTGVTLVAFYDESMPVELCRLIQSINRHIVTSLADNSLFTPYGDKQIHGTVVGLEGLRNAQGRIVTDSMKSRKRPPESDVPTFCIDGFLEYFRSVRWPISLQFGGYQPGDQNPYDLKRHPWSRSFEIRENGLAVLMGWSTSDNSTLFSPQLLGFRKDLESFGAAHKYHIDPQAQDNDFYIVIGEINANKWPQLTAIDRENAVARLNAAQDAVRQLMAQTAVTVPLGPDNVWVIKYRRTTLEAIDFAERIQAISRTDFENLYP